MEELDMKQGETRSFGDLEITVKEIRTVKSPIRVERGRPAGDGVNVTLTLKKDEKEVEVFLEMGFPTTKTEDKTHFHDYDITLVTGNPESVRLMVSRGE
ncbi:TPA: hypothetical protein EYP38_04700 [Candidatus Micrarchaeota archaeon]|nr:hypothetical protein [Candidatus Micrarchaeota archaeon]